MTNYCRKRRSHVLPRVATLLLAAMLSAPASLALAQERPANNMDIVHEKLKADKKLLVATYMKLSEAEATRFWPIYEEYQKELEQIDARLLTLLQSYAADMKSNSLTDDKAKALLDTWIAIENDDAKRRASYAPKVLKALPPRKAARYLQIENEYRIVMRYDLAVVVPLVQ